MNARAYYNEHDPYAAQWLRNLIAGGHIAPGEVDERSVVDVRPDDVAGFAQCHFFAGIGGWSLALRLAGWPDDHPVWTGSCPCQPFSAAGRRGGFADERHLWPVWFDLIRQCRPAIVLGEQVEAAVRLGWLDAVLADLEDADYACGAVVLGAHSVGAPHIRQRLWFVADAGGQRRDEQPPRLRQSFAAGWDAVDRAQAAGRCQAGVLGDPSEPRGWRDAGAVPSTEGASSREWRQHRDQPDELGASGPDVRLGDADRVREAPLGGVPAGTPTHPLGGPWSAAHWLPCRDERARPAEPGTFPLAHGLSGRVGRLRAYGNAIVPQAAAEFIGAVMDMNSRQSAEARQGRDVGSAREDAVRAAEAPR